MHFALLLIQFTNIRTSQSASLHQGAPCFHVRRRQSHTPNLNLLYTLRGTREHFYE